MDLLYQIINQHENILIRSEFVVKKYKYFNPANTTDFYGLYNLWSTCDQIFNYIEIFSQDLPNGNFSLKGTYDKTKYNSIEEALDNNLQEFLFEPNNRNPVIYINLYI